MAKKSRLVLFVVFAVIIAIIIRYQLDKYIIAECKAEYLKIKDQFVYARYRNNEYELWTSDEYFVLSEKEFFKKHKLFLFSNKITYSKKYNIMLYHAEATVDESNRTFDNEIFAINFNTCETSFLGYGNHPYKDAAGELYYASNNIIYRYDPEENKTIEFFTHKKTLFEYSDVINGFIILENTLFIFTSGYPDFKGFKGYELIIYTDKNRLRLKNIIFTDGAYEMEKQKRFLSSFAGIDIIQRR